MKKLNENLKFIENYINKNTYKIFIVMLIILTAISFLNLFFITFSNLNLNKNIKIAEELNKPAKIQLISINCKDCFDITPIINQIENQNVEIINKQNINYNSEKAQNLILKYNIKKLPSIIITGEVNENKINLNNFKLIDDAFILEKINAPYFDVSENKLKGKVSLIEIIDPLCDKCISLSPIPDSFGEKGVLISNWEKIDYNSKKGKELINRFKIKKIPSLLISNDINYYKDIKQGLAQLNLTEKQGFFIIHSITPPYRDLIRNKIVGLVNLIMLTDNSCNECYDVNINKQILKKFGIVFNSEKIYDIKSSKGKQLISKYDIEKVPIILLSPDANEYSSLVNSWSSVGTIENDKWFVMRKPEIIGKIKLLNFLLAIK